jgi:hypothetical protein
VRARLSAYAGFQLRDFLVGRALPIAGATAAGAWVVFRITGLTLAAFDVSGGVGARDQLLRGFQDLLGVFALVAAIVAAQGLVARDRRRGYDRLLFSRPLSPSRYYGQGFLIAGASVLTLAAVASQVFAIAVLPVSVPGSVAYVAVTWLVVGGLAFALSTLTAHYVPLLVLLVGGDLLFDRFVDGLRAAGSGNRVAEAAQYLLPPAHVVVDLRESFTRGRAIDPAALAASLAWPLAFGVLCLCLALVILRRRPFGS